ncbi:MAG: DNA polymerase IV [Clostridia bacterium]|nr:DNA polymerase IV [Clostridia bacterium]
MQRLILHSDLNCFYASVECLYNPQYRDKPAAVCGDPEKRHGIILAKNYIAKGFGVYTGQTVWEAKQMCPGIVLFPARFEMYKKYSALVRDIYYRFTNQVEPYGLDEAWLDISKPDGDFDYALETAKNISSQIKSELGLTVSIGVSFTKSFAKLGSDYKKPEGITVISPENYKDIVWPLPVSSLIYVGRSTEKTLAKLGIYTLGDLAASDERTIKTYLGKNGVMLKRWAQGLDYEPVADYTYRRQIKSVGNSVTLPYDIYKAEDIEITLMVLAESVAERLREKGLMCRTVQIEIKESGLYRFSGQKKLKFPSCVSEDIYNAACELFREKRRTDNSIRALGVRGCDLTDSDVIQLSLEPEFERSMKQMKIDEMLDSIRNRYGHGSVKRASMLFNPELSAVDPKAEHTVYPGGFTY